MKAFNFVGILGKKRQKETEKWKRMRKDKEAERYECMFLLLKQWRGCFCSSLFLWFYLTKQITVTRLNLNLSWRMGIYSWFMFVFTLTDHFCFTLHPSGDQHSNWKTHMILSQMLTYSCPTPPPTQACTHLFVYLSTEREKETHLFCADPLRS